ncbi:hypothetical protein BSKO_03040 [Bryopsis sp. KO-2023]|nr:hypothetical protein BSKO_03040 [Bryopsis sp. KO-2023]
MLCQGGEGGRRGAAVERKSATNHMNLGIVRLIAVCGLLYLPTLCIARPIIEDDGGGDMGYIKTPMIVVFKDNESLGRAREMCFGDVNPLSHSPRLSNDLPDRCRLTGSCNHVYTASIKGISGKFSADDLQLFRECIPQGVRYTEADGKVSKEEDTKHQSQERKLPVTAFGGPAEEGDDEGGPAVSKMDAAQLAQLVSNPGKKSQRLHVALWNLDRVDQRDLPLDKTYHYGTSDTVGTGRGVTIYILDSGVRPSHREFKEWLGDGTRAQYGYDFVDEDPVSEDCDGHGTHVASSAIGRSVGIAKQAKVVAVRVLDCGGSGNISTTVAGLDWVINNHQKPAVVAMSLGVSIGRWSRTLEDSVKSLINTHGIPVVVASGNSGVDSCFVAPANVPETITVAASNLETKFGATNTGDVEGIYRWSNTGKCVDVFAPGVDIYAACGGVGRCSEVTDGAYTWASGTSMAVPHVAGVVAMYLGENPTATPAEVKEAIVGVATMGKIKSEFMKPDTPNRMLYSTL